MYEPALGDGQDARPPVAEPNRCITESTEDHGEHGGKR